MAAGSTYTPIATTTLGSAQSSVTFNSFSGYTDLVLVCSIKGNDGAQADDVIIVQCNGDTGSNYSSTLLYGSGSSSGSQQYSNTTSMRIGSTNTKVNYDIYIANFQNYSNTTTYKTVVSRESASSNLVSATVGSWRSTSAITSFVVFRGNSTNFAAASTFTLYGITAA